MKRRSLHRSFDPAGLAPNFASKYAKCWTLCVNLSNELQGNGQSPGDAKLNQPWVWHTHFSSVNRVLKICTGEFRTQCSRGLRFIFVGAPRLFWIPHPLYKILDLRCNKKWSTFDLLLSKQHTKKKKKKEANEPEKETACFWFLEVKWWTPGCEVGPNIELRCREGLAFTEACVIAMKRQLRFRFLWTLHDKNKGFSPET